MIRRSLLIAALMVVSTALLPAPVAAGGGCHAPMDLKLSTSTDTTALIEDCAFQPSVTYIDPGDKVTWRNDDIFGHTVTGVNGSWGGDRNLSEGDTVSFTFEEEGVFPYYCAYHPSMVGAVVVGDGVGTGTGDAAAVRPADDAPAAAGSAPVAAEGSRTPIIPWGFGALGVVVTLMMLRAWKLRRRHASAPASS